MIFVTRPRDERPLFTGYVNGITERDSKNGGTIKTYTIGTNEKKQDDSREYSSWFCIMIGNARQESHNRPLSKGDRIAVYGFKQTNVSRKNPDGTYTKAFFNMSISDYERLENTQSSPQGRQEEFDEFDSDDMPF